MRSKARDLAQAVSSDLVGLELIDPRSWPVIGNVVTEVIQRDREEFGHDEEDTLP